MNFLNLKEVIVVYLIDPMDPTLGACTTKCHPRFFPLYGIGPKV